MKYYVSIGTRTFDVEVDGNRVTVDGVGLETDLAAVSGTPLYHLLLGGESWTVAAEPLEAMAGGRWGSWGSGGGRGARPARQPKRGGRRQEPARPRRGTVRAPMPGLVVRIEVAEGQHVDAGAGLVVVEAMKMENELRAPRPGTVQTVHVAVGRRSKKAPRW